MTELLQAGRMRWTSDLTKSADGCGTRRIAVVGLGPEGLAVLERLLAEAAASPHCSWLVDLYEPHAVPGAGAVYDPSQPSYLRMDRAASEISLEALAGERSPGWMPPKGEGLPAIAGSQSLLRWAAERGYRIGPEDYVPRALVGRYLHDIFCRLCASAPANVTLSLTPWRVEGVRRSCRQWVIEHRQTDPAQAARRPHRLPIRSGPTEQQYDQVFVTTRDRSTAGDARLRHWAGEAGRCGHLLIDQIYPTRQRLSLNEVAPRRSVAVRGFGPAAVDAILALTEGRGGLFVAAGGGGQHVWRYLRGWREPSRICVFSPHGRLPLPRPSAAVESGRADGVAAQVAGLWQRGRDALTLSDPCGGPPRSLWHEFLPVLIDCTVARWQLGCPERQHAEPMRRAIDQVSRRLYGVAAGRWSASARRPNPRASLAEAWRQEALVAWGQRPLSLRAASALVWRQLAPHWMQTLGLDRLRSGERPALRRIVRYFDALASGPPVANVARMLALIDAGVVDLTFYRSPQVTVEPSGFQLRMADNVTACRTLIAPTASLPVEPTTPDLALRPMPQDGLFVLGRRHAAGLVGGVTKAVKQLG